MTVKQLRDGRRTRGWSQQHAAARLGVSQSYLSMLEKGKRALPGALARKAAGLYRLPPAALPLGRRQFTPAPVDPQVLAEELAALGYPGFAYLHRRRRAGRRNPAETLLAALAQNDLEARTAEALPWLLLAHPDLDAAWLAEEAHRHNLQNRLGFMVALTRELAVRGQLSHARQLADLEASLERSRLAVEDTFCQASLTPTEGRWLRKKRSKLARHWNLLTDWSSVFLRYAA
jgi:transcriptional regulator with XRE-family HTH domain